MKKFLFVGLFYLFLGLFVFRHLFFDPGIWNYGDANFPFNEVSLKNFQGLSSHAWSDFAYLGFDTTYQGISKISFIFAIKAFYFLTHNFSIAQFLWWVFIFATAGFSSYLLFSCFAKNNLVVFTASLFGSLNPFFLSRCLNTPLMCQAFAFIPLLLFLYLKALDTKKDIFLVLLSLPLFFIISSLHYFFIATLILFLYFVYRLLIAKSNQERKSYLLITTRALIFSFLILAFYFLPVFYSLFFDKGGNAFQGLSRQETTNLGVYWGHNARFYNVFRLLGYPDSIFEAKQSISGLPRYLWLTNTIFLAGLWLLGFLHKKRKKIKDFCFWSFLFLLAVFLTTLGSFDNLSVFTFFKFIPLSHDPTYYMYLVLLPYSILVAFGFWFLTKKIMREKFKPFFYPLIFFSIAFNVYPLFLWRDYRFSQVTYPLAYDHLAEYLKKTDKDARVLLLPTVWAVERKWAPYMMNNWSGLAMSKPFFGLVTYQSASDEIIFLSEQINNFLPQAKDNQISKLLGLVGIDSLVITNDLSQREKILNFELENIINNLKQRKDIRLVSDEQGLMTYRLDGTFLLPKIYGANLNSYLQKGLKEVIDLIREDKIDCTLDKENNFYFCSTQKEEREGRKAKINFQKINNAYYQVEVQNSQPIFLVLNESFNKNWQAVVKGKNQKLTHFKANGFANGWILENQSGTSKVEIFYRPEKFYKLGILLSLLSLGGLLIFSIFKIIKNKGKDNY